MSDKDKDKDKDGTKDSSEIKNSVKVKDIIDKYLSDKEGLCGLDLEFPDANLDLEGVDVIEDPDIHNEASSFVTVEYKKSYEKKNDDSRTEHRSSSSNDDKVKKVLRLVHSDEIRSISKKDRYLETATFIVFDIETSGGNPQKNGITEIFAIKYKNGVIEDRFHSLVNPRCRIPAVVRKMTGLDNRILQDAPYIEEVMPKFVEFIQDYPMVSHNIVGDMKYLDYFALKTTHKELVNKTFCTQLLSEKLFSNLPSKSLEGLMNYFNLTRHEMHRAEGDAYVTLDLFKLLVSKLKENNIFLIDDALRLQGDLLTCMRLGWKIDKKASEFPSNVGLLYFYEQSKKDSSRKNLLYVVACTNIKEEFQKLSDFTQLPKQLIKTLVNASEVKYSICSDYYQALQKEANECKNLSNPQLISFIKHQRGLPALIIAKKKDSSNYLVTVDSIIPKSIRVYGNVFNRTTLMENISQLANLYGLNTKKLEFSSEYIDEIEALFSGCIEKKLEELKQKKSSFFNKIFKSKKLDSKIARCTKLVELKSAFPSKDYLNESGIIVINCTRGWKIYPLVRLRGFLSESSFIHTQHLDSLNEKDLKQELLNKIDKLEKKCPRLVEPDELLLVIGSFYWLLGGGRGREGFFVSSQDLASSGFRFFELLQEKQALFEERQKGFLNKKRKSSNKSQEKSKRKSGKK